MGSQVLNEVKQQSGVNVNSQRFSFWLHTEVESVQAWPENEKIAEFVYHSFQFITKLFYKNYVITK